MQPACVLPYSTALHHALQLPSGDFLMALLRDLVAVRRTAGRPLKVVLMSATLDSTLFADYFGGCPVLHAQVSLNGSRWLARLVERACLLSSLPCAVCPGWEGLSWRRQSDCMHSCWSHEHCSEPVWVPHSSRLFKCNGRKCHLCLVLQGRTFPVEQLFLEDCYQATGGLHKLPTRRPKWIESST